MASFSPPAELQQNRFQPASEFTFEINRAERTQQARLLVPLLADPRGRAWFLERLCVPCTPDEARAARPYHLAFPLRDLFTADFYACRGRPDLEPQLIAYYNELFGLPGDYGADTIWRTHPGGPIRHPAAPGRSGWHHKFLSRHVSPDQVDELMRIRQLLDTETDAVLFLDRRFVIVECKYLSHLLREQYERQVEMGRMLEKRLDKRFCFVLVVQDKRDVRFARIAAPYVLWSEIEAWLHENVP